MPSSRRNSGEFEDSTQPFGNIMAQLEAIDTPKAVVAVTTGEEEIISHEQKGEVPVPHHDVTPQEVKAEVIELEQPITITKAEGLEVIEQPITATKVEDNAREDNAQEDTAREDNTPEDNAIVVKEEPISTTSTELESSPRPQKAMTLRDPRPPLLHQLRTKLSLLRTSDAGAVFHRNLKTVRLLYSWKFYFCIASVAFAYIIRTYHQDIHLIYPLA